MTFVITQNCCADASCIPVCPVDCIRPAGPGGADASMLYIAPDACVDCGACEVECPVGAIYHEDELPADQTRLRQINADYFTKHPLTFRTAPTVNHHTSIEHGALRVAIVGAGPAACYAASELVSIGGVEVDVFEQLPTPYGLIRAGVAPDHQRTKEVVSRYEPALASAGVHCYFNVTVGRDISHDELVATHHAVIYAVGTSHSRELGISGEHLPGNYAAADFVAWYNGAPGHAQDDFALSSSTAVVVGNGNVALDVARVLVMDRDELAKTDIADHAYQRLAASAVQEVVILGRRGAGDAAFSVGELLALGTMTGVDVAVAGDLGARPDASFERALKYDILRELAARPGVAGNRRIVFQFSTQPVAFVGTDRVEGLVVAPAGEHAVDATATITTSLVLRSIGYRGAPLEGLPFDDVHGVVPNVAGRVTRDGEVAEGLYVTGWIKRGPRGVIGTNRACAAETVSNLIEDFWAGRLHRPLMGAAALDDLLSSRLVQVVDWQGWQAIDAAERARGEQDSRPRSKFVDRAQLLAAAAAT